MYLDTIYPSKRSIFFFEIPIFSYFFLCFLFAVAQKPQHAFRIIWVGTPVPLAGETTKSGSPMKKTPKNTSGVKIFKNQFNLVLGVVKATTYSKESSNGHRRVEIEHQTTVNAFVSLHGTGLQSTSGIG